MEDTELRQKLDAMEAQIARVEKTTRRIYRFFLVMVVVSVVAFALPLIGLLFAIPTLLSTYATIGNI
ncbi:MAG: hypothetical protein NUV59_01825 [Patescibacteria group bacterium]|nr:hypothetical protein [Patescibacteria group bacterium]